MAYDLVIKNGTPEHPNTSLSQRDKAPAKSDPRIVDSAVTHADRRPVRSAPGKPVTLRRSQSSADGKRAPAQSVLKKLLAWCTTPSPARHRRRVNGSRCERINGRHIHHI